ncbi:hypothetical protein VB712_19185 [Spirulina sp. CCNP1310]|uniref:hypothetical protein n=1 Tax=Spirulina sp. CCNP1310 TaxID=3110249 RepID=UPI002B201160|nr:hypothetical protein [Spirulina sp. CCNP1310]MEA5421354.1 hypothetical protein [Spirulina sp. CCNP1310]
MFTLASQIARQIASLPWRDRLTLLKQILWSFFPSFHQLTRLPQRSPDSDSNNLTLALSELQRICREENYSLDIPSRLNRGNPFNDE